MLQAKKINSFIILGIFIFNFCFFLTTMTNNTQTVTNNTTQKSGNVENNSTSLPNSQSNTQPYNSSSSKFYSYETCNRYFDWTLMNNTNVSFATPSLYNSCNSNITFNVMNATVTTQNVETDITTATATRLEQAQAFKISYTCYLTSISIYTGGGKKLSPVNLEIRSQAYNGSSLYSIPLNLTSTGWKEIDFTPVIFMTPGRYFVWMSAESNPAEVAWMENPTGTTTNDTWSNTGGVWSQDNYNMTLKVKYSGVVNPENVSMTVGGHPITPKGQGTGYVNNIISTINGDSLNLSVNASYPILYSYNVSTSYERIQTLILRYSFLDSIPDWNLTLNLDDPIGNYTNYNVNITGFKSDYTNIQVFNGSNVVAYTRCNSGANTTITIQSVADLITFQSPNYISKTDIPQTIYAGGSFPLNISAKTDGNITIAIYSGSNLVYFNSTPNNNSALFTWNVSSNIPPGNLDVNITYFGDNEVGYFAQTINLIRQGILSAQPVDALSLQSFKISCSFKDKFTGIPIQNASVTYSMSNITGTLNYDKSGDYSQMLNSNIYALTPGVYNVTITAQKSDYQSVSINSNITIGYRPLNIQLSRSSSTLHPGNTLNLKIGLTDNATKSYLERPVNLGIYIVPAGNNSTENAIMFQNFNATTQDVSYDWAIPKDVQTGNYNILVRVKSDYYSGNYNLDNGLTISSQKSLWYLIPIIVGAVVLATGIYIQRNKVRSRHSVKGIIILHENGSTLSQRISKGFGKVDPALISSAVTGIISIIKEITGKGLRTLAIEGGYVNIARGNNFWLILFMEYNPSWIKGVIRNCVSKIEKDYGEKITNFKGKAFPIEIDDFLMKNFHVTIYDNPLQESLKKQKKNAYGY